MKPPKKRPIPPPSGPPAAPPAAIMADSQAGPRTDAISASMSQHIRQPTQVGSIEQLPEAS
jgi:hypothetical protein